MLHLYLTFFLWTLRKSLLSVASILSMDVVPLKQVVSFCEKNKMPKPLMKIKRVDLSNLWFVILVYVISTIKFFIDD